MRNGKGDDDLIWLLPTLFARFACRMRRKKLTRLTGCIFIKLRAGSYWWRNKWGGLAAGEYSGQFFFILLPMATSGAKTATLLRMVYDTNNIYIRSIWFKETLPNQLALALAQENSCVRSRSPIQKLLRRCFCTSYFNLATCKSCRTCRLSGRAQEFTLNEI